MFEKALRDLTRGCKFKKKTVADEALLEAFSKNLFDPRVRHAVMDNYTEFDEAVKQFKRQEMIYKVIDEQEKEKQLLVQAAVVVEQGKKVAEEAAAARTLEVNAVNRGDYSRVTRQSVRKASDENSPRNWIPKNRNSENCSRCGRNNHSAETCYLKDAQCHKCSKVGHIAKMYTSNGNRREFGRSSRMKETKRSMARKMFIFLRKIHQQVTVEVMIQVKCQ
jgi:hypothetical protein